MNPITKKVNDNEFSKKDFDLLNLGLNFELLELELFTQALNNYTIDEWKNALNNTYFDEQYVEEYINILKFMRDQEIPHSSIIQKLLNNKGAKPCKYNFPVNNPKEFLEISQIATSVGEGSYLGFIPLLDNRTYIEISSSIVTTESRQNTIFREGLHLHPFGNQNFDTPLTASQAYTLGSQFIVSCPENNPKIPFTKFPYLDVKLNRNNSTVYINYNDTSNLKNNIYVTFINQLNVYYEKYDKNEIQLPNNLNGTVFILLSNQNKMKINNIPDNNIIAGPNAIVLN
jgi:hypothetical protein